MEIIENVSPNSFGGVHCLGHVNGDNHFISRRGEYRVISSTVLEQGHGILDLFASPGWSAVEFLSEEFPPNARSVVGPAWDKRAVGADLIQRSAEAGFFDRKAQLRSYGTWRLADGGAVAHCGERLVFADGHTVNAGCRLGEAIFAAYPQRPAPVETAADVEETRSMLESVRSRWGWDRPAAAGVLIGWIGAAALGGFPRWRTHIMVSGRRGSGKSRLVELADKLLGGMSDGVLNDCSEAGIRQSANGQARALLFDEAERDAEAGQPEKIIRLFRIMSGGEGARVARGTAAHSAKEFNLVGAGYLSSILPGRLAPQDRSRIVQLQLGPLPTDRDASAAAQHLEDLEEEARTLGPAIWPRMLEQTRRWDRTHRAYKELIHVIGGESRDGDTIGTILTGWDLMLYDDWPENAEERRERLELARNVALCR
jgi:hypothetical protein